MIPPARSRAVDALRLMQRADGAWTSYWWLEPEYATFLAVEGLIANGTPESDRPRLLLAHRWLVGRSRAEPFVLGGPTGHPSPFSTALVLGARTLLGDTDALPRLDWLLDNQLPDGSWEPSDWLLRPDCKETDPDLLPTEIWNRYGDAAPSACPDVTGLFTTATVLQTLATVSVGPRLL